MHSKRLSEFRVWVDGAPKTFRKSKKSLSRYLENIQGAAKAVIPYPIKSRRIDIEIWFRSEHLRPDVDNVVKPILDALQGIVYFDDKQIRSVKVVAVPHDDAYSLNGWSSMETFDRLDGGEFFIDIYEGLSFPAPAVKAKRKANQRGQARYIMNIVTDPL